ncbi:MAG: DUF4383 domain-containing protein [Solirubrobacterales bacterium]
MPTKSVKDYGQSVTHGSVAQMFAVVAGVLLTVIGVAGLIVNMDFGAGSSMTADKLLFLDVNGWSSVLHLITGLALLVVAGNAVKAKTISLIVGGFYVLLTIWSLFDNSILGMLPVNDPTAVMYAAIGVVGLAVGLGPDKSSSTD